MKKIILVAVLLMAVSVASFAGSTTATATATVNAANVSIKKTADLALGSLNQGAFVSIAATATGAAAFSVTGGNAVPTLVAITYPGTLANGSNTMTFTSVGAGYQNSGGAADQSTQSAFTVATGGTVTSASDGSLYLWVGGKVTATATQAPGSYTGTLTITVTQ